MLPRLPLGVPTYGVLVAIGFLAALWLARALAPRRGLDPAAVQDVVVVAALCGLVAAKLGLLVTDPRGVMSDPAQLVVQGGVFYFGLVGGVLGGALRLRRHGIAFHAVTDVLAAPLAVAHALGRVGCFFAGCCWGTPSSVPWAVVVASPEPDVAACARHPVQLYEAFGNLVLALVALAMLRSRVRQGVVWWTYVGGYGSMRIAWEGMRDDPRGSVVAGLSTSTFVGVVAVVVAAVALVVLLRPRPAGDAGGASAAGPAP